jgi:thiamine biosynthesis lipoprotein ApbE
MGLENGMKLVEEYKNVEAILINEDKHIFLSSGLQEQSIPNRVTNEDYSISEIP